MSVIFRPMEEGESPDRYYSASGHKRSSRLPANLHRASSSSVVKDFLHAFVDHADLTAKLEESCSGHFEEGLRKLVFEAPFEHTELQNLDYALEGASFQTLVRMPTALYASETDVIVERAYLAIEDFLLSSLNGLWATFWGHDMPMPFSVAGVHSTSFKLYPIEKAIARGKLDGVGSMAILLKSLHHPHGKWNHILASVLFRSGIANKSLWNGQLPTSLDVLGEALFYAVRMLLSRSRSRSTTSMHASNSAYVLVVDCHFGMVVKVEGNIKRLELEVDDPYGCAADWIHRHAKIFVTPVDQVWNKLGNANWGDVGTLQLLLAMFHGMVQFYGTLKYSLDKLAAKHSSCIQSRQSVKLLLNRRVDNGCSILQFQKQSLSPENLEVRDESVEIIAQKVLTLEVGSILWIEDANRQKGFRINEIVSERESLIYVACPIEEPESACFLYFGSSPRQIEPAIRVTSTSYQDQRHRVLALLSGLSSKYLPRMIFSGCVVHPDRCNKSTSHGTCSYPWCGTQILAVSPVGSTVTSLVQNRLFTLEDALRCCHDCLSSLAAASALGIRHGNICPENLIRIDDASGSPFFVLIGWDHAALDEKHQALANPFFSSTYALQTGKLCATSDAESLIYLLYYSCGGVSPKLESVHEALQWRESLWSRRVVHQTLGQVSAVLKAFADYIDSLCGTTYRMDYRMWLKRLRRTIKEDLGKEIDASD